MAYTFEELSKEINHCLNDKTFVKDMISVSTFNKPSRLCSGGRKGYYYDLLDTENLNYLGDLIRAREGKEPLYDSGILKGKSYDDSGWYNFSIFVYDDGKTGNIMFETESDKETDHAVRAVMLPESAKEIIRETINEQERYAISIESECLN